MTLSEWRVKASPVEILPSFFPAAWFPWMLRSGFLAAVCTLGALCCLWPNAQSWVFQNEPEEERFFAEDVFKKPLPPSVKKDESAGLVRCCTALVFPQSSMSS